MITICPSDEQVEMRIIPRIKDIGVITARLINEKTEDVIELKNVQYIYRDGFLFFQLDYIFDKDLSTFSLDLIDNRDYIYRGRIQVISKESETQTDLIYV